MRTTFLAFALAVATTGAQAATIFNANVFSAAGADAASIQSEVDGFRAALGGLNPNTPENFAGGRREINWDGVPDSLADPNAFPGDFFNGSTPGRARGIEFVATGETTGFEVSSSTASGVPILFDEPDEYSFFSPERIFRPVGGDSFDVLFFDPTDQTSPATTTGLGVVFTGLEEEGQAVMSFFGEDGELLLSKAVTPSGLTGLSFLGVLFDVPVAKVSIFNALGGDEPVMDDFIFGEPTRAAVAPVPLPAAAWMLLAGLAGLATLSRRRAAA
ncbi:VPLPA-CTERM sorting domain-containing protein [Rubrimonas cliftonensis]|uniref:VPLPA-CTERM protein sorting domain-containing protein n=1 Tax=Rubrimonas cliftonensis TaxID=89524 RepID=A0A1H4GCX2_9RHOB|nr:VPLPA-CTERM sorting domain-containing protein [Rubrimonas cliftonensis]SEB07456.1 VPLPA-CTERM protein sorting domain-containing protein [Rubrimonas cliftonensis]